LNWKDWNGKRIYIVLKSGRIYTGQILSYKDDWFHILDKFGMEISLQVSQIEVIQEDLKKGDKKW
jgi:small nuclear ribonucleoprotein (snRNP)-like protein